MSALRGATCAHICTGLGCRRGRCSSGPQHHRRERIQAPRPPRPRGARPRSRMEQTDSAWKLASSRRPTAPLGAHHKDANQSQKVSSQICLKHEATQGVVERVGVPKDKQQTNTQNCRIAQSNGLALRTTFSGSQRHPPIQPSLTGGCLLRQRRIGLTQQMSKAAKMFLLFVVAMSALFPTCMKRETRCPRTPTMSP